VRIYQRPTIALKLFAFSRRGYATFPDDEEETSRGRDG
jgi:hypothetical protein